MKKLNLFAFIALFLGLNVFAQTSSPTPSVPNIIGTVQTQINAGAIDQNTFLADVLMAVQGFGGLSAAMKIAVAIMLLIALMKVTSLDDMIWGKLGKLQAFLPPILGLIAGIIILSYQGNLSMPGLFAYIGAGAGAILFHELLDAVKGIPGLGAVYVGLINFIEGALGGNPVGAVPSTSAKV